ncbi:MAG: phage minor head protein [Planctomycetota bacterium]
MPTAADIRRADERSDEADALGLTRVGRTARMMLDVQRKLIADTEAGRRPSLPRDLQSRFEADMADTLVAGHLLGRADVFEEAERAVKRSRQNRLALDRIDQVTSGIEARFELNDRDVDALRRQYGERAKSIFQQLQSLILPAVAALSESITVAETVPVAVARLRTAFRSAGVVPGSTSALETLYRTNTRLAWSAGEDNADQDAAIREILWGYTYRTVGDDRVRPNHAAMDNITLPVDDPFWNENRPPNGYNCRCILIRVFNDDPVINVVQPEPVDVDGIIVQPQADPGFQYNPGRFNRDVLNMRQARAASMSFPPNVRGRFRTLLALHRRGGSARLADLASDIGRAKSTVTSHISNLVDDGLVEHDAASWGCTITRRGADLADQNPRRDCGCQ